MKTGFSILSCLLLAAACSGSGDPKSKPNFLLFSIDTLRADHLGCYGNEAWDKSPTPVLDRLASQGVLFEKCYAPRGQTHPSIASMLTGKYPVTHSLRENGMVLPTWHRTVAQILQRHNYATAAFVSNMPADEAPLSPMMKPAWWTRGFDRYADGFGGDFKAETVDASIEDQWAWDQRAEEGTLAWIDEYDPGKGRPFFLWTHFYDPHKPYLPHPSSPDYLPGYEGPLDPGVTERNGKPFDEVTDYINEATRSGRPLSEEDRRKVLALYDASTYGAQDRFDRILDALNKKGLLENTWILFTTDHGEELGDHNAYYYHGASIYEAVLHIPLIIVGPGAGAGRRTGCLVQNLDITPTMLKLAGFEPLPGMEGYSLAGVLLDGEESTERDYAVAEWQDYIYSWSDGTYKYIMNPKGACPVKPPYPKVNGYFEYDKEELYHLPSDPAEQENIIKGNEEIARDLRKKLLKWLQIDKHRKQMNTEQPGKETLGSLGYVDGGVRKDVHFKD